MTRKIIISVLCILSFFPLLSQSILTLEQCRELALKNNIQSKNAALSVQIAGHQEKEAFTNYFPKVNAIGSGFSSDKPIMSMEMDLSGMIQPVIDIFTPAIIWGIQQGAPIDPNALAALGNAEPQKLEMLKNGIIAGVQASQPVFAGGLILNGNRLAKAGREISELQKQISDNELLLETERYFWQLVSLKEKMKTVENSENMLANILSDVKIAVEAGLATQNDFLRVELEQNKLESGRLKLENSLQMLKMVLAHKIGMPAESFDIQQPEFDTFPAGNKTSFEKNSAGLQNRPEYKLLDKSVEVSRLQHAMETGKNMPALAVGAAYSYMNFDIHKDDGMKTDFAMIFATISIPVSDWWGGSHAIRRKKLEMIQAENTKKENTELLLQQMQSVQYGLNEAYQQVLLAKKSILSSEENLKMSQSSYNAGVTALSDLLEAQNLLQQSHDQYVEAASQYFQKQAEWKQVSVNYF